MFRAVPSQTEVIFRRECFHNSLYNSLPNPIHSSSLETSACPTRGKRLKEILCHLVCALLRLASKSPSLPPPTDAPRLPRFHDIISPIQCLNVGAYETKGLFSSYTEGLWDQNAVYKKLVFKTTGLLCDRYLHPDIP